jgi:glycolate oxidase
MPLNHEADYLTYLYTCNRCRSCAVDATPEMKPVCPSYARFGYFTYSGGGKGYVAQGILEGKVPPSPETAEVAMNCLLCGACAAMCPPGFDTLSFIRDLRDRLAGEGFFINDKHRNLLERARRGEPWGKPRASEGLPVWTGSEEVLVFLGCREKTRPEVVAPLRRILAEAGVSWGVLEKEPCCGAPLKDLGDAAAFQERAESNIDFLNGTGAERILVPCPHCAATLTNDYFDVGDLEVEIATLPSFLAELLGEKRLKPAKSRSLKVTFHDPCRLSRFLEETEESRKVLRSIPGLNLVEMDRHGKGTWCCGSAAWASQIVPGLSRYAAGERRAEALDTGADLLVTACSFCTDMLRKNARGKPAVIHLAELVAQRLESPKPARRKRKKEKKQKNDKGNAGKCQKRNAPPARS